MFKPKKGDNEGFLTAAWGPPGWMFLHCIAQNYPWEPSKEQKRNYYNFFKTTGFVLPCRYCRESYQKFIEEPETKLSMNTMKNRFTLAKWLYLVHNKVNKKLDVKEIPPFKEIWSRYESYRSKCTKTPEKVVKKGCTDPLKGYRKKCVINIIPVDENGKEVKQITNFGKTKKEIKLISIKRSTISGKKLTATFNINGRNKVIHFGNASAQQFIIHKNIIRRNRFIFRHYKDLKTNNPIRAGYLSMFILWNKPSLQASITDYRRRLSIYNRTGKFPTKISGYVSPSKKSKYQ